MRRAAADYLCQQIPAPHQHLVRYYGYYSNRSRGARAAAGCSREESILVDREDDSPELRTRRRSWTRLLRRIFEVDSLVCPQCNVEMKIVSVLTEPSVVDRILRHVDRTGGNDPFQERAPPEA